MGQFKIQRPSLPFVYLSTASTIIVYTDTDTDIEEITLTARHMNPPRGHSLGEIWSDISDGMANKADSKSEMDMLRRNRLVKVRISFLLVITMQTNPLPEDDKIMFS